MISDRTFKILGLLIAILVILSAIMYFCFNPVVVIVGITTLYYSMYLLAMKLIEEDIIFFEKRNKDKI